MKSSIVDCRLRSTIAAAWLGFHLLAPLLAAESSFLYGIHDHEPAPGEFLNHIKSGTGGAGGWVTATVAIGANPDDTGGVDFSALANAGHTVICRLNHGYFPEGTIPVATKYDDFATRCKNFVANSSGCSIWLIGNESNLNVEWPLDPSNHHFNYLSPASYADCYRRVYNAIKSIHPNDRILPQALAPWGGPYGGTGDLNGSGYPADGMPLNWVQYLNQMLTSIQASGPLDGIALHVGSRGYSYADIHRTDKINAGGQDLYWSFKVLEDWVNYGIPPSLYHLPIYVTECNGLYYWKGGGPPGEDLTKQYETGWLPEIFAEFDRYNQSAATNGRPIVRCVNLYRWCGYCDGWNIDGVSNPNKAQILADLDVAVAHLYRWPTNLVPTSPPAAPGGLVATVGNAQVILNWNPVGFADRYRIKRATSSGGPYAVIATNVTTEYVDTSFTPNTTYYYRVSALNGLGESADSGPASATPTNGLPDVVISAVNWTPTKILGGTTLVFRATVKNQGSAATPTSAGLPLGVGFSVGGGNYTWATYPSPLAAGASVTLTASGGADGSNRWRATPGAHTVTANADDVNRFAEAREDNNTLSAEFNVFATTNAVNCGGVAAGNFAPDAFVSGGYAFAVTNLIDISGVANAAPEEVYRSERWQNFVYTFPQLVPGATYVCRLHFAEIFVDAAALRRFHVAINDTQVLTNLDIFAEAGGKFRALVKSFIASADASGQLTVTFSQGAGDWPKCSGIEVNFLALPVNTPPSLTPVPAQILNAGATVSFSLMATDTNLPPQALTYSLAPGSPTGTSLNPTNGLFTWTAPDTSVLQTNSVTVRVADDGSPPLTNSITFDLVALPRSRLIATPLPGAAVGLQWDSFPARSYRVQYQNALTETNWISLSPDFVATTFSLAITNGLGGATQRFYRVLQLD